MTSDRPAELAEHAFTLFAREGIDGVTMDHIAAAARVTKGSLYWHYQSKDEVVLAACRHYYRGWHRAARRVTAPLRDPLQRLRALVGSSVRSCLIDEKNRVFTMEIITRSLYDRELQAGWREFFDGVRAFYLALVGDALHAGQLEVADPEEAVDGMLAAMEGYKLRAVFEPELCSTSAESKITRQLLALLGDAS